MIEFNWELRKIASGIRRGLADRQTAFFLRPHDAIWGENPEDFTQLADEIFSSLPDEQTQRQFLAVCLGSYLLNPAKAPKTVPDWVQGKIALSELVGIDVQLDELISWRWDRAAFPVLDEYEKGKNDTIYYALIAKTGGVRIPLYPSWAADVMNTDALDAIAIAAELAEKAHPGSCFFFWPFINPLKPTHDRSLGLPVYLSFLSLAVNKPVPPIIATGEVDRQGGLLPVRGVQHKWDKAFEKGYKYFIYPVDDMRLERRRECVPLGVEALEQAQKAWHGCKKPHYQLETKNNIEISPLQSTIVSIRQFIGSPDKILIVYGMTGTDIEAIYSAIVNESANEGRNCHILAPNRRKADRYDNKAESIYSHIYSSTAKVKKRKLIYDYKKNIDVPDQIYVIGDGHLVSDSPFDTNVIYGSGQLLSDFIKFAEIGTTKRQLIIIGDPYQMTRGKFEECALSPARIQANSGINPLLIHIEQPSPEEINPFTSNCFILANSLKSGLFNQLQLILDGSYCMTKPKDNSEWKTLVRNLFSESPKTIKILASEHKKVNAANTWIRENIFNRKSVEIAVGDIIHLHNSFYASSSDFLESELLIPNDSFAEILSIDQTIAPIKQRLKGRENIVEIRLIKIKARFHNDLELEFICLKDFIYSEKPEIETDIQVALYVNALERFKQQSNKSKAPEENLSFEDEVADSEENISFATFLRKDLYYNAARIRFGYALTLNRAQGQHFDTVIADLNTGIGQHNDTYFRWLYTLLTVVSNRLIVSNVPHITPLSNIQELNDSEAQLVTLVKPRDLIAYEPEADEDASILIPVKITQKPLRNLCRYIINLLTEHGDQLSSYQEKSYHVMLGINGSSGEKCQLKLHHDKRFHVTKIETIISSTDEFSGEIRKLLTSNLRIENELQRIFYNTLADKLMPHGIEITAIEHHDNQEMYFTQSNVGNTKIQVWYHNDGFISKLNLLEYTSNEAVSELKSIVLP